MYSYTFLRKYGESNVFTTMNLYLYIWEEYLIFSKSRFTGDWHTAYLLLYGPRKLPKDFKKADQESEAKEANVEKMET